MAAQNMGPTGPIQVKDVVGATRFTGVRRPNMVAAGPQGVREASFSTVRHAPGRWKHIMVAPVQYKMRGYNPSTGQDEYWQTNNPAAGPPSGASLTNKTIAAVITDSFPTSE